MDMSFLQNDDKRYERHHFIPCSKEDYDQAMRNELPDKWWQFYQKLMWLQMPPKIHPLVEDSDNFHAIFNENVENQMLVNAVTK